MGLPLTNVINQTSQQYQSFTLSSNGALDEDIEHLFLIHQVSCQTHQCFINVLEVHFTATCANYTTACLLGQIWHI